MQRFGAACWSGDINNDFATLEAQIPLGLNTGLSGVPYWGTDVGGFFHAVPETGRAVRALVPARRLQPDLPLARLGVARARAVGARAEVEAICRRYAELRYRLLPYTYTLAWQAHTLGLPLMRPLVLNYPDDPRVWQLASEFLWGDDLLVAPVTREGATAWPVYLPAGGWFDFWTGARFEGPAGITVEAPLDRLPLFVRAGAIVPMGPVIQHTGEPQEEITLLIHPEGTSRFELYEDDGRSRAYRQGHHALTTFQCVAGPAGATVHIGEPAGDRSVVPAGRRYLLRLRIDRPTGGDRRGPRSAAAGGRSGRGRPGLVGRRSGLRRHPPPPPARGGNHRADCDLSHLGHRHRHWGDAIDPVPSARLTRRSTHRRVLAPNTHTLGGAGMARRAFRLRLLTAFTIAVLLMIAAGPADAQKKGGMLRVGNLGEPPALDAHWTTASITETLTNHIYEGLYSLDRENKPHPDARGACHTVSKDGLTYTFKLRQGVKFHNGKEMTSEDVVASLNRWGKQSIYGKALFAQVAELKAVDKYTVEMKLKEKSAIVLISLAVPNNFGAIYPKEIAEKFAPEVKVDGVRGDRALQARRVEARPVHPDGALRRLQDAATRSRTATAEARPRGWTRSAGSPSPKWRPAWPRSRRASSTSPTT